MSFRFQQTHRSKSDQSNRQCRGRGRGVALGTRENLFFNAPTTRTSTCKAGTTDSRVRGKWTGFRSRAAFGRSDLHWNSRNCGIWDWIGRLRLSPFRIRVLSLRGVLLSVTLLWVLRRTVIPSPPSSLLPSLLGRPGEPGGPGRTIKRFPSPRCASAIEIVRPGPLHRIALECQMIAERLRRRWYACDDSRCVHSRRLHCECQRKSVDKAPDATSS
jgi:hypothetical protein